MATRKELEARLAELEAGLTHEAANKVDPVIKAKAEQYLQFQVNDVLIALNILEIVPTEEQITVIEEALINAKIEQLTKSAAKAGATTKAKWGE